MTTTTTTTTPPPAMPGGALAALGRLDHIAHSLVVNAEILANTKQGDPESARIVAQLIASSLFSLVTEIEQAIADLSPTTSPF